MLFDASLSETLCRKSVMLCIPSPVLWITAEGPNSSASDDPGKIGNKIEPMKRNVIIIDRVTLRISNVLMIISPFLARKTLMEILFK